jgi:hypothetical protein
VLKFVPSIVTVTSGIGWLEVASTTLPLTTVSWAYDTKTKNIPNKELMKVFFIFKVKVNCLSSIK